MGSVELVASVEIFMRSLLVAVCPLCRWMSVWQRSWSVGAVGRSTDPQRVVTIKVELGPGLTDLCAGRTCCSLHLSGTIDFGINGCDLVALKVRDVCHGYQIAMRAVVMQHKTQRPVQFEIASPRIWFVAPIKLNFVRVNADIAGSFPRTPARCSQHLGSRVCTGKSQQRGDT